MGCNIGHHSVVGAGAVVPQFTEVPPWSVVVGVPAKVLEGRAHGLIDEQDLHS
jgi:acetyltransferase-like isoleucine patch superfamily enzyme